MKYLVILLLAIPLTLAAQQTSFGVKSGPLSNCPAPAAGIDILCDVTNIGWEQSINGAAYSPLGQTSASTITIGTVTTLPASSAATVTNSGTNTAAVLNFGIPIGATGLTGAMGPSGTTGAAATITLGTIAALPVGASPVVTNSGTSNAAVLNFSFPVTSFGSFNCATYTLSGSGLKAGPGCTESNP